MCLEQHDLISILKLKLGPAVKVFGAIRALRQKMLSIPLTELTADHANAFTAAASCFPCLAQQQDTASSTSTQTPPSTLSSPPTDKSMNTSEGGAVEGKHKKNAGSLVNGKQ